MEDSYIQLITFLYGSVALVSMAAYAPQIYNLIISTGRSEAVSISSWILWMVTSGISLSYSTIVIKDLPLILVNLINFTGVVMILLLTIYNRYFRFGEKLPQGVSARVMERFNLTKTKRKNERDNSNN